MGKTCKFYFFLCIVMLMTACDTLQNSPPETAPVYSVDFGFSARDKADEQVKIALTGFDWQGRDGVVTLYWQAEMQPIEDYLGFVHLISTAGKLAAQVDQAPDANLPTSQWPPGHQVADAYTFDLNQLAQGNYLIVAGLYAQESGSRLYSPTLDGATIALLTIGDTTSLSPVGPDCIANDAQISCQDHILGIEFAYPAAWGAIQATLHPGGYSGTSYRYIFNSAAPELDLVTGGLSEDFSEGRGGWYNDFMGFQAETVAEVCTSFPKVYCEEVKPNVLLMILATPGGWLCDPGPSSLSEPKVAVAINLSTEQPVQGFIILSNLLSDAIATELRAESGFGDGSNAICTEEKQNVYDKIVARVLHDLESGAAEAETQRNFQTMLELAESIAVIQ